MLLPEALVHDRVVEVAEVVLAEARQLQVICMVAVAVAVVAVGWRAAQAIPAIPALLEHQQLTTACL